jgi:uncharacterized protein (TIGR02594 family)
MTYQTYLITSVQQALADLGYYTGPIDGVAGPLLESATTAFKERHGMLARPYPGPLTLAALFGGNALKAADAALAGPTPWLDYMVKHLGVAEIVGPNDNPLIVQWGKDAGISWWHSDDDAWCAVAVNAALVNTGFPSTKSALARSFTNYGTKLDKPVPGAIVVFPRGQNPLYGHVGVVEKISDDGSSITVINGNVANAMRRTVYRTSSAIAFRAPPGSALAGGS